jgi:hypothetical protein
MPDGVGVPGPGEPSPLSGGLVAPFEGVPSGVLWAAGVGDECVPLDGLRVGVTGGASPGGAGVRGAAVGGPPANGVAVGVPPVKGVAVGEPPVDGVAVPVKGVAVGVPPTDGVAVGEPPVDGVSVGGRVIGVAVACAQVACTDALAIRLMRSAITRRWVGRLPLIGEKTVPASSTYGSRAVIVEEPAIGLTTLNVATPCTSGSVASCRPFGSVAEPLMIISTLWAALAGSTVTV